MSTPARRAPLTYRAYRFPHCRGRLARRWGARGRVFGFTTFGLGTLMAAGVFLGTMAMTAVAFVTTELPNVEGPQERAAAPHLVHLRPQRPEAPVRCASGPA